MQLSAVPYSGVGVALDTIAAGAANATWYSTDSTLVRVTPTGLVRARGVTGSTKIYVVARRQVGGITREDRAMIQVVDVTNPPVLASFRSRPADSLKRANGTVFIMIPQLKDQDSVPLTGYPVHYRSSNTIAASVTDAWSGSIMAGSPVFSNTIGRSKIAASTMAFGVALVDTFTVEVGYSINPPLTIPAVNITLINGSPKPYLVYPSIDIGPGGVASFRNNTGVTGSKAAANPGLPQSNGTPIDYIFDDSLNVKAASSQYTPTADGNIFGVPGDTLTGTPNKRHYRKFPTPGRYEYTVQPYGLRGVVIVHDR